MKMSVFSPLIVALTAATLAAMVASESSPGTQETIDKVCRQMEEYQFCNQTFNNNLPQPDTDNVGLTKITIVEAQNNSTNTVCFIRAQIPGQKDPVQLNHYKVCENAYAIVQSSFDQALQAFNQGDYRGMAQYEREAPRAQASCQTIFAVPPQTGNTLNERNREMRILIAMAVVTGSFIVT